MTQRPSTLCRTNLIRPDPKQPPGIPMGGYLKSRNQRQNHRAWAPYAFESLSRPALGDMCKRSKMRDIVSVTSSRPSMRFVRPYQAESLERGWNAAPPRIRYKDCALLTSRLGGIDSNGPDGGSGRQTRSGWSCEPSERLPGDATGGT